MAKYTVHLTSTLSVPITVDADDPQSAIDAAFDSDEFPGVISGDAFGMAPVDHSNEWEPESVADEHGEEVWKEER